MRTQEVLLLEKCYFIEMILVDQCGFNTTGRQLSLSSFNRAGATHPRGRQLPRTARQDRLVAGVRESGSGVEPPLRHWLSVGVS